MKQKNYEKGITLIALVITIIILLILAGVTLNIVINSGIVDKSETAVDKYRISGYKENIEVIKTGEYFKKISDNLLPSLKELVANKLESKENEGWVKTVETSEEDAGLEENQIKVITKDEYIIVAEIEEDDGKITYITIEKDNGEPYPSLEVEVLPLEGTENEKVKIQVKAEVEKIKKTKKIAKIELIKDGKVIETRTYDKQKVEDIFEVEENGTYRIKAITDQEKSTSKKAIVNIIQITSEPTTSRNTESEGTKNGVATGPITVTIEYGETELQKQYKVGTGEWQTVSGTSTQIQVSENTTVVARYYDGTNGFETESYNIQNVDNVAPQFTNYNVTVSGTTISASATATDTASVGAASGIEGILRYEYKLNNGSWQTKNTFTISTPGEYTAYIKAIDKAGNEKIENKTVTATGYTVTLTAGTGIDTVTGGKTILAGQSVTISATVSSGHTFKEWKITNGTGSIVNSTSASTTVTPTSNISIEAIGEKKGDNINGTDNTSITGGDFKPTNPVIPVGFKTSDEGASWEDANNDGIVDGWNDGLVIEDKIGNQFVWVPSQIIEEGKTGITGVVEYKKWTLSTTPNGGYGYIDDTLPIGNDGNAINETAQIKKYGGFYIARYEAGIPSNLTTALTTASKAARNVSGTPVSKKNQVPWNYINCTNSKANAQSMYSSNYVKSGLVTGRQWDATMKWLENANPSVNVQTDSTGWGNYRNAPVTGITEYSTGSGAIWTTTSSTTKNTGTIWTLKTGHTNYTSRKNIYDLAGNLSEWSNEIFSGFHVWRGGDRCNSGTSTPAAYRGKNDVSGVDDYVGDYVGFRCVLYVQ